MTDKTIKYKFIKLKFKLKKFKKVKLNLKFLTQMAFDLQFEKLKQKVHNLD